MKTTDPFRVNIRPPVLRVVVDFLQSAADYRCLISYSQWLIVDAKLLQPAFELTVDAQFLTVSLRAPFLLGGIPVPGAQVGKFYP